MPDITIPDAAVEAASIKYRHLGVIMPGDMRLIIAAAAPHIEAAVRDHVAREIEEAEVRAVRTDLLDRWGTSLGGRRTMSPHRAHMIVQLVRADAARIARGKA